MTQAGEMREIQRCTFCRLPTVINNVLQALFTVIQRKRLQYTLKLKYKSVLFHSQSQVINCTPLSPVLNQNEIMCDRLITSYLES